jgi:hypothetical protein
LEFRRATHKAAEQKRRDSLKQGFDKLKKVVPHQPISNGSINEDGKSTNNIDRKFNECKSIPCQVFKSLVFLLKRGMLK